MATAKPEPTDEVREAVVHLGKKLSFLLAWAVTIVVAAILLQAVMHLPVWDGVVKFVQGSKGAWDQLIRS